ncbi:MAG: FAD-binding oxidoreductase [Gallionellaceae bacterium]|nr:FAD-binding oxidoreductase [Gallionellaceae bacterium]
MEIHGWGRYPRLDASLAFPLSAGQCAPLLGEPLIARGLGRGYGDCALAPRVLDTRRLDHLLDFDPVSGVLTCAGGATLADIVQVFVPRGWFLPVTPGTRFVTVGGAVASDVHGKNHHVEGSFCEHVIGLDLLLGNGERVQASASERPDLFRATCGGMGLTGVILAARLRLKPIRSAAVVETTIKTPDLDATLAAFAEQAGSTYSVAWIDCLARGRQLGRSVLMLGEHADDGPLALSGGHPVAIPVDAPAGLLNRVTMAAFNALYYARARTGTRRVGLESFFYPLDALADWNRLYGRAGFLQYQFVVPEAAGLRVILERIAASGRGSFLAVLKAFGKGNDNLLSFPHAGYTLALDFKAEPAAFELLDSLDRLVLDHGGRLYLAKDARMSAATFRAGYPRWQEFEAVRERHHAVGRFASALSRRLELQ